MSLSDLEILTGRDEILALQRVQSGKPFPGGLKWFVMQAEEFGGSNTQRLIETVVRLAEPVLKLLSVGRYPDQSGDQDPAS